MVRPVATVVPVATSLDVPLPDGLAFDPWVLFCKAPPLGEPGLSFFDKDELVATFEFNTGRVRSTFPPRNGVDELPPLYAVPL